jgi:hypothetical protein
MPQSARVDVRGFVACTLSNCRLLCLFTAGASAATSAFDIKSAVAVVVGSFVPVQTSLVKMRSRHKMPVLNGEQRARTKSALNPTADPHGCVQFNERR